MRKGDRISVPRSPEHRAKLSKAMLGNHNQLSYCAEATKNKISLAMSGNTNTLGKVYGETTRLKDRVAKRGEGNPAWNGGSSFEPYPPDFNATLKESVLSRDNYTCQLCGAKPESKKELHPHHIDYDKMNCKPENLIVLCHSCHSKTNHHREEWGVFNGQFQRIPVYA